MSLIKNFALLSVSIVICYCMFLLGDWFLARQINVAIEQQIEKSEARKIEDTRSRVEDIPQREKLISEGFLPIIYPNLMDTLDIQFPLIAGLPATKTYYCNEGYGLVRYQSDRFGFRNKDTIWDANPKVIMIGDSFVHGACVSDEKTLPQKLSNKLNLNVINLGISGNNPSHYYTYAYLFIPKVKPQTVYLNFYPNDNGVNPKSRIEYKYVDLNQEIFEKNSLSFADPSLFFDQGMKTIEFLKSEKSFEEKLFLNRVVNKFLKHAALPTIKSLIGFTQDFKQTENTIKKTLELCVQFDCNLVVSFIPNSEYYRPDPRADGYADKIKNLTSELGLNFIDGRDFINRKKDSDDFAIKGPHLSPVGYEKMAKRIASIK